MPRGQFTDSSTKMQAVVELSAGADLDALAAKYGVNPKTIAAWKKTFDEGGLLDDTGEPAQSTEAAPDGSARAMQSKEIPGLALDDGSLLPALGARRPDEARRKYDDDFRYAVGKALLSRKTKPSAVSAHYAVSEGLVRQWAQAVQDRTLKPSRAARIAASNGATASTTNGHANGHAQRARGAASQQQLSIEGIPPMATTQIVHVPSPTPTPDAQEIAALLLRLDRAETEVARLTQENARLNTQLRQAFDMVLARSTTP